MITLNDLNQLDWNENIITVVKFNSAIQYYVSEFWLWVLNLDSWRKAYEEKGYDMSYMEGNRWGISIVDISRIDEFLEHMKIYYASKDTLRTFLSQFFPTNDWWEVSDFFPELFVDFDECHIFSVAEHTSAADCLPDGWTGILDSFYDQIPNTDKYWIIDGKDFYDLLCQANS